MSSSKFWALGRAWKFTSCWFEHNDRRLNTTETERGLGQIASRQSRSKSFAVIFRHCLGLFLCGVSVSLCGQVPLVSDDVVSQDAGSSIELDWQVDSAERALNAGLVSLAESIYRSILEDASGLSSQAIAEIKSGLSLALIGQRRFIEARTELESIPAEFESPEYPLLLAISIYGDGTELDQESFRLALGQVKAEALLQKHLPWFYLLQALRADMDSIPDAMEAAYAKAIEAAESPFLKSHFKSLALRQQILNTPAGEELAAELASQVDRLEGQPGSYPFVREYAVVLHSLGRIAEAVGLLERALDDVSTGYSASEREQLRLLKGTILGADSVSGRNTLKVLIRNNGRSREVMSIALQLLARAPDNDDDFLRFLNEMTSRTERHALFGQMLYLRSQVALSRGMMSVAERDARDLLEQFPGLSEITNVYRLLAYTALKKEPRQYRAAADLLIQLRDQSVNPEELVALNRMIGDSYYLNGDFANAVDFYNAARARELSVEKDGGLFLRLVSAYLKAGQIEPALTLIDEVDFIGEIDLLDRWRAEWNVAQALQAQGDLTRALERVRLLLNDRTPRTISNALDDIRLYWLEAYLSLEAGETEGLIERVNRLLARLDSLPREQLDPADALLLRTEILLLRGSALMQAGDANAGIMELSKLRELYTDSPAAERSYLIESAYYGLIGDLQAAQETLTQLSKLYPESPLAPQAIFEAALYCERRGVEFFEDAVVLHNDLAQKYPQDPLLYYAGLKQGDLLRALNDFSNAQNIYETLINAYPSHPKRYIAELSRADCMLALAGNRADQLIDVTASLERLVDLPNLPLDFQAEVAYKWAFALIKYDDQTKAKEVLALSISSYLLDGEQAALLGPSGRYWLARSMLKLGEILEIQDDRQEARRIYRKLVAYNLPGRNLALSRIDRLAVID